MGRRIKYTYWANDDIQRVIAFADQMRKAGLRVNWRECSSIVQKSPRQCYDLYRNRVVNQQRERKSDHVGQPQYFSFTEQCNINDLFDCSEDYF